MISITPAIKSLKIRNYGRIEEVDLKFTQGINMIYGPGASGKTTFVNVIDHMVKGEKLIYGPTKIIGKVVKTEIEVKLWTNRMYMQTSIPWVITKSGRNTPSFKIGYGNDLRSPDLSTEEETMFKISEAILGLCEGQAIILDDVFDGLSEKNRKGLINLLRKSKAQAIITTKRKDAFVKGANIIRLVHEHDWEDVIRTCYEGLKGKSKILKLGGFKMRFFKEKKKLKGELKNRKETV